MNLWICITKKIHFKDEMQSQCWKLSVSIWFRRGIILQLCFRFVFTLCIWTTEDIFKCFSLILCKYYSELNTHSTLLCNQASGSYLESLIISVSVSHFLNFVFFQNQSSKTALERFPENMSEKCLEPRFDRRSCSERLWEKLSMYINEMKTTNRSKKLTLCWTIGPSLRATILMFPWFSFRLFSTRLLLTKSTLKVKIT